MAYGKIFRRKKQLAFLLCLVAIVIFVVMEPMLDNVSTQNRENPLNHLLTYYGFFKVRVKTPDAATRTPVQTSTMTQKTMHLVMTSIPTKADIHSYKKTDSAAQFTSTKPKTESMMDRDRKCEPRFNPDDIKTPFKFYIYDLPPYFNDDLKHLIMSERQYSFCYNLDYCGMGEELKRLSNRKASAQGRQFDDKSKQVVNDTYDISIRNTHQFSLEIIIHYKLLHSPYRTLDPRRADIFYIPAYTALKCNTDHNNDNVKSFTDKLFEYLQYNETHSYRSGKPHFSTVGKIQRESIPLLRYPDAENITYITIERESKPEWHTRPINHGDSMIVAPYPSYVHFTQTEQASTLHEPTIANLTDTKFILDVPAISERNVFLFLAAGTATNNHFRARLIDQFAIQTRISYHDFFSKDEKQVDVTESNKEPTQVMLITHDCSKDHRTTTIPWMMQSLFCLQPAGDSPTRKSFFDSILSGCIPVLFTGRFPTMYPFQKWLQYDQFTITFDEKLVSQQGKNVSTLLQAVPVDTIERLHNNVRRVAKWFQYSIPNGKAQTDDDAVTLLLKEVQHLYNLTGSQ